MQRLNAFHLNGLRAVEAVARAGSLQRAADELGVSPSAVSQQINRTERQMGRAIFARTASGLVPTAFGAELAIRLSAGFRELEQAVALADAERNCTLVVSVAPAFAAKWLVPRLSRFFAIHPEILFRIDASTALTVLDRSDVDVAIRMGDGSWPDVKAELLMAQEIFPVCAPSLAAGLKEIGDLARYTEISDENTMFTWEDWFRAIGAEPVPLLRGASFTNPILCLDAVIAGHGVMLAWQLLAADALADGRLVAPFAARAASGLGYWLVTSSTERESRKVRAFKAWLSAEIAETAMAFAAARPAAA